MKTFVAIACFALAIPAAMGFFDLGTTSGLSFPFFTIGGTATTGAASGLAITGLASGTALAAGLGGVAAAAGAGALAAVALRAATSRRAKRSVADDENMGEQFIFDAINAVDKNNCGKRYVCELAATPVELLSQSEVTSLLLFQTQSGIPESGKAKFDEAVRLGVLSRSAALCQQRYSTCPILKN